jgi:PEP-CTERM motif
MQDLMFQYHDAVSGAFYTIEPTYVTSVAVLGDYNEDGTVDAADYTVWRNNLGSGTALPNDDIPGVGPDDYVRWKSHFGQTASGAGAVANVAVPEPTTSLLLMLAAAGWCLLRGRAAWKFPTSR